MNWPANPVGIGPILRKPRKPFNPNTRNLSPNKKREPLELRFSFLLSPKITRHGYSRSFSLNSLSRIDRTHAAKTLVLKRLMNFRFGVHHERTVARDWFIQRHTRY